MKGITRHPGVTGVSSSDFNGTMTAAMIHQGQSMLFKSKDAFGPVDGYAVKMTRALGFHSLSGPVQWQALSPTEWSPLQDALKFHKQWSSTRGDPAPQGTSGNIWRDLWLSQFWGGGGWREFLLASSGWRSGMSLNIQQCTQDNPQQQRMVWPWGLIVLKLRNRDIEGLRRVWAPPSIYYGRAKQDLSCLMVDSSRPSNNEREVRAPLEGLELSQAERNRHTGVFQAPKSQCWAFSPCSSGGHIALWMSSHAMANSLRTMLMFNES